MEEEKKHKCALCRDELEGKPVRYKGKDYCCEACAFEASIRIGSICGSRNTVESSRRYSSRPSDKND